MTKKSYIYRNGKLVEITSPRNVAPRTQLITDIMPGTRNPVDGRMYDSRSRYQKAVRAAGSHIIEAGERPAERSEDTSVKSDVLNAAKSMGFI